jgi:hypothetical protein
MDCVRVACVMTATIERADGFIVLIRRDPFLLLKGFPSLSLSLLLFSFLSFLCSIENVLLYHFLAK